MVLSRLREDLTNQSVVGLTAYFSTLDVYSTSYIIPVRFKQRYLRVSDLSPYLCHLVSIQNI